MIHARTLTLAAGVTVLAAQLIPVTAAGHAFWEKEGADKQGDQIQFCKNLGLIGGLLTVALNGAK